MFADQRVSFLVEPCNNRATYHWGVHIFCGAHGWYYHGSLWYREKRRPTLGLWIDFSAIRKRFGDIKISDLMAVNTRCHFNALGNSYQQKVSTLLP
ncbi:hypothetical protein K492DRAFT_54580 [Lichtheimia hyalospora FSU 10163]|nr:hypothetical protein K492DRAFT_54580 [Lichtheimia hyalospora FSU 10163]